MALIFLGLPIVFNVLSFKFQIAVTSSPIMSAGVLLQAAAEAKTVPKFTRAL